MNKPLLEIVDLQVSVEGRLVVQASNFKIETGEIVVLLGVNGSGKSSMTQALMGDAKYQTDPQNRVDFAGRELLSMSPDERAKAGLFVAWQNPISIAGLTVFSLCKASYEARGLKIEKLTEFKQLIENLAVKVGLPKEYVGRSVNEGFSGGEKKRLELLQMLLLKPKLAILDEIDSGLDTPGVKILVGLMGERQQAGESTILITHNKNLLNEIRVDQTWEMQDGRLSARI